MLACTRFGTRCDRETEMDEGAAPQAAVAGGHMDAGVFRRELGLLRFHWDTAYEIEPADAPGRPVEGAERLREPAQRAGGRPAQHDAFAPRLAQHRVEPVCAPRAEHADDVAATNVDQILCEQVGREVVLDPARALVAAEQRHVAGLAAGGEAPVKAHYVVVGVTRGCR